MDDSDGDLVPLKDLDSDIDSDTSSTTVQKSKLPLVKLLSVETERETGFCHSVRKCLERIREAMLHHRWQEAADYMACYPQVLQLRSSATCVQYKELVWRIGTEILNHHPNSTMEDSNISYELMKHSGVKLYLTICLEHCFHQLLHGRIEEAKQQLFAAECWRHGMESTAQHQRTNLIKAYKGLLEYIIWCDNKSTLSKNNILDSENQGLHTYFRQATVNFQEIMKSPGVWDPFILSYIEMLEFYGDHEEALKILDSYAYDNSFPPNPNAHAYMYHFLKRHGAPLKKQMKALKNLHVLVPSHELMLEYSHLLLQSEKKHNHQKALGVLLDVLDFACWRSNLDAWKSLRTVVQHLLLQETRADWEQIVQKQMASRKDLWPAIHFTSFHDAKESKENPELWKVKASLTQLLCPDRTLRYGAVKMISGRRRQRRKQIKTQVKMSS